MTHYTWKEIKVEPMFPRVERKAIHTERMTLARVELKKGSEVPVHSHHHEQVTMVESGALRFDIEGQQLDLKAGDSLVIPSHAPHGVVALEDTVVFDIFSPHREDWPR